MIIKKINILFLLVAGLIVNWSCTASYSFSGASISPEVKTVSIDFFPSNAPLSPPISSQLFTEALRDVFLSQTNLIQVKSDGDLELEGYISNYTANPVAIQGNQTAASTRVTMTVMVNFRNNVDEKQSFESSFSSFEDFESTQNLSEIETDILMTLNSRITQDIFNKAVTNW